MNNLEPILGSETEKLVEKFISQQGGSDGATSFSAICFILIIIILMLMYGQ